MSEYEKKQRRDAFAMSALIGVLGRAEVFVNEASTLAVALADALIAELDKP